MMNIDDIHLIYIIINIDRIPIGCLLNHHHPTHGIVQNCEVPLLHSDQQARQCGASLQICQSEGMFPIVYLHHATECN